MDKQLILHHYPASPFSEKVRVALGLKGMAYQSVRVPAVMPKPDVVALTGGYRRTPLLQMGNHVYCDTALIVQVLERLTPTPSLFKHPAAEIVAQWADHELFDVAVSLISRPTKLDTIVELMKSEELQKFQADRAAMREDAKRFLPRYSTARAQLPIHLGRIEAMLADDDFTFGEEPSVADLSIYHCLWFLQMLVPDLLPDSGPIPGWMERMAGFGHGSPSPLSSDEALEICRTAAKSEAAIPAVTLQAGPEVGDKVTVRADDWGRDIVEGTLVASGLDEIAISREDPRAGVVVVHFPRLGYELQKQRA